MSCSLTERVPENAGARSGAGVAGAGVGGAGTGCRLRGSSNAKQSGGPRSSGRGKRAAAIANSTSNGGGGGDGSTGGTAADNDAAIGPSPPRPKPCLCWCCCCGCNWCRVLFSATPGKGSDENGPSKNSNSSDINCDDEPPVSIEEIRTWGRSFDRLMKSTGGRKVFREFLKCEYSEENILFWVACEDLKAETNAEGIEEKARIIYEDYISILSPKEVSLDSRVREIVNRNMMDPTPNTFEEAQLQIYTLMHRDSYPRFVNSAMYKQLAQTQHQPPVGTGTESSGDNAGAVKEPTDTTSTG